MVLLHTSCAVLHCSGFPAPSEEMCTYNLSAACMISMHAAWSTLVTLATALNTTVGQLVSS